MSQQKGKIQQKVYQGRHCKPFPGTQELNEKNMEAWYEFATDLHIIRMALKQFLPRLRVVCE